MTFTAPAVQPVHQFIDRLFQLRLFFFQFLMRLLHAGASIQQLLVNLSQALMSVRQLTQHVLTRFKVIGKLLCFKHVEEL